MARKHEADAFVDDRFVGQLLAASCLCAEQLTENVERRSTAVRVAAAVIDERSNRVLQLLLRDLGLLVALRRRDQRRRRRCVETKGNPVENLLERLD